MPFRVVGLIPFRVEDALRKCAMWLRGANKFDVEKIMEPDAPLNFAIVEREYVRKFVLPEFEWATFSVPSRINPLSKPLSRARVALVTTGGVHCASDPGFNTLSKKGDHSYREIPASTAWNDLKLSHVGYNIKKVAADINCVFPLQRLRELADEGVIGEVNHRHFSFMGYIPITPPLLQESGPEVARKLKHDEVDLVVLAPA